MDYKNFVLEYYKNAENGIHIQLVHKSLEAIKFHSHEYFQIYYITKGDLIHHIDEKAAKLTVGDMFIVPPGVRHRISESNSAVFYSLSFRENVLNTIVTDSFSVNFLKTLKTKNSMILKISLPSDEVLRVESIVSQMHREFELQNICRSEILRAYILILISIFTRLSYEHTPSVIPIEDGKQFILHVIKYIENNFSGTIDLDSMVRLSAMSKTKFCREFKSVSGHSFNHYLNLCRINKAKEYIRNGYKITAIYGLVGYNDFSTFYRNFIKITGVSPAKFKRTDK